MEIFRKHGLKAEFVKPHPLSPEAAQRHQQVTRAVRTFLNRMDRISQSAAKIDAPVYAKAAARHCYCGHRSGHTFQKTRE